MGLKQQYLKLSFLTVTDLLKVRKEIMPHARKNRKATNAAYTEMMAQYHTDAQGDGQKKIVDTMDNIIDIRFVKSLVQLCDVCLKNISF